MNPQASSPPELAAVPRLFFAALGWTVLIALGPGGVMGGDPHPAALLGVAILAFTVSCPGPHAFTVEWLVSACAAAIHLEWLRHVVGPVLIVCGLIYGFHGAVFGLLLRRVQPGRAWAFAVPVAWCAMEAIRFLVPVPFGMRWIQLGHHAINFDEIVGAARVVGPTGISFALAALAGLYVDIVRRSFGRWSAFSGLAPIGLLLFLSHMTQPPESVPGPVVLLVQPAVSQADKQNSLSVHDQAVELTREGLDFLREKGDPPPDVVCWGETMLGSHLLGGSLEKAVRMGMPVEVSLPTISEVFRVSPERAAELKARVDLLPMIIESLKVDERRVISDKLLGSGKDRILPPDCGFISGAVVWVSHEGEMRKENSVCAWSPDGRRTAVCSKLELVPGGETLYGLGSFKLVSDFMMKKFRYLPNFLAGEEAGVMDLPVRPEQSERSWRATGTVCYDNSFLHPYTDPLASGERVDLHLICSNEAWYLDSWEMDQMVCMSRMIAISTARPVVRTANSGISCVLDAQGKELGRVQRDGVDREVPGFLALEVPVPPKDAPVTPFCRLRGALAWIFVLLAGIAAWGSRRSGGYQEGAWE